MNDMYIISISKKNS